MNFLNNYWRKINRNKFDLMNNRIMKKGVNLEWWSGSVNLGDNLANVILDWMLARKEIENNNLNRIVHLMTVGSLIGANMFDAVVWGSGLMNIRNLSNLIRNSDTVKYDIRAVRGPLTKDILQQVGYDVSNVIIGDPGVLLPLMYTSSYSIKKYSYTVIPHHANKVKNFDNRFNYLDIQTKDYKTFVDTICKSELVISSSLHGLIIAEAYGIPAVFMNDGVNEQLLKYYDWYYSTDRYNVKIAKSIDEAIAIKPMDLPNLCDMQNRLLECFPYDLWT